MNKNLKSIPLSATAEVANSAPAAAAPDSATPAPKRGFKPRWLRLQRRERKLREARALALRPVVG